MGWLVIQNFSDDLCRNPVQSCLLVKLKAAQMEHRAVLSSKDSIQRGVTNPHTVGHSATAVKVLTG